jgi:hypothetical protein
MMAGAAGISLLAAMQRPHRPGPRRRGWRRGGRSRPPCCDFRTIALRQTSMLIKVSRPQRVGSIG